MDYEFDLQARDDVGPPFAVIYGPSGTGKTTLAASAPKTVFLQTEDGAGELKLNTLKDGVFTTYEEFMAGLRYIYQNFDDLDIQNIAIDSLDHLEPLVWDYVCRKFEWDSIEAPGYGKGYVECDSAWRSLIKALLKLRDDKNVGVICIAHDIVRMANDPTTVAYDMHELKLHKRAVALWKENAKMIGLLKNTITVDKKTGKAKGGTAPSLFVRPNAAYTAKTRYKSMPSSIPIKEENGWEDVAKFIPFYQT